MSDEKTHSGIRSFSAQACSMAVRKPPMPQKRSINFILSMVRNVSRQSYYSVCNIRFIFCQKLFDLAQSPPKRIADNGQLMTHERDGIGSVHHGVAKSGEHQPWLVSSPLASVKRRLKRNFSRPISDKSFLLEKNLFKSSRSHILKSPVILNFVVYINLKLMQVLKFGGSSVSTPERIKSIIEIVRPRLQDHLAIVFSAFGGVTDQLIEI